MTVDEVVKLILAISFALSLVGVSWQLMRFIGKLADSIEDARTGIKNASRLSTMLTDDYDQIRTEVWAILDGIRKLREDVLTPLLKLITLISGATRLFGSQRDKLSESQTEVETTE